MAGTRWIALGLVAPLILSAYGSDQEGHCVERADAERDEASLLQFKKATDANRLIQLEASRRTVYKAQGRLHLAPNVLGCFPRDPNDGQDAPQYMDLICARTTGPSPCRSGLPFYRLPLQASQTYLDCCSFCADKGLDLCGLAGTATPSTGAECRCGATKENVWAWRRRAPRESLLFPATLSPLMLGAARCSILVWTIGVELVDGEVPEIIQSASDADQRYINAIIDGDVLRGVALTRGLLNMTNASGADLHLQLSLQQRAMAQVQLEGLCKDQNPTGFSYSNGQPASCSDLRNNCNSMAEVRSVCPLTCRVCSPANGWLSCFPNACGPGGGPWPAKAQDGLVYINYWFDTSADANRRAVFQAAVAEWAAKTCIRFVQQSVKPRVLVGSFDTSSCSAIVGYPGNGNVGKVNLGWCSTMSSKGSVIHELGHVVGMNHEQNRPDATTAMQTPVGSFGPFLTVYWNNIAADWQSQYTGDDRSYIGSNLQSSQDPFSGYAQYNYESIMHYGRTPNNPNFDTTNPIYNSVVGQRTGLSPGDISQVNDLYQCASPTTTTTRTTTTITTRTTSRPVMGGTWSMGTWGPCVQNSGQTTCAETRSITCVSSSGATLPTTSCSSITAPPTSQSCTCPAACQDLALTRFVLNGQRATCPQIAGYCNDPTYGPEVIKDCPMTCGKCGACSDKYPTRFSFGGGVSATCTELKGYCSDATYGPGVREDCPLTCNRCPCRDIYPTRFPMNGQPTSCSQLRNLGYCTNPQVSTEVKKDCPRTCGTCSAEQSTPEPPVLVMPAHRILESD